MVTDLAGRNGALEMRWAEVGSWRREGYMGYGNIGDFKVGVVARAICLSRIAPCDYSFVSVQRLRSYMYLLTMQ